MAAIILAALLALVLSIAAADAGTCINRQDGTDTVQSCDRQLDASKNYSRIGAGLIQSVVFEGERGHGGSDGGVFRH